MPAALVRCIADTQPSSLILVPELLQVLVVAAERGLAGRRPRCGSSPSAVPRSRRALLQRAAAAGMPVFEGYGLSECASVVCLNTPGGATAPAASAARLPHVRVRSTPRARSTWPAPLMLGLSR